MPWVNCSPGRSRTVVGRRMIGLPVGGHIDYIAVCSVALNHHPFLFGEIALYSTRRRHTTRKCSVATLNCIVLFGILLKQLRCLRKLSLNGRDNGYKRLLVRPEALGTLNRGEWSTVITDSSSFSMI